MHSNRLMKMKVAVFLVVVLAFASAGKVLKKRSVIQNIVGGTGATPHSFPWMAALVYADDGSLACAGSLIEGSNAQYYFILTAAHCVDNMRYKRVRLGEHDFDVSEGTEQEMKVRRRRINVIKHPDYKPSTLENDVALLRISKSEIDLTSQVKVGTLTGSDVTSGDMVTVAGWGTTTEGGNISPILRQVEVEVQSHATCGTAYPGEYYPDSMFCAGPLAGGQDACQGDSGGPVMINRGSGWEIVGIVSWGYGCARRDNPGVYSDVFNARTFINSNIDS